MWIKPSEQALHEEPDLALYVPLGHTTQELKSLLEVVPGGQATGVDAPDRL